MADKLGLSRTSIWNQIKQLHELGIEVDSIRGKGYRLVTQIELICPEAIIAKLSSKHPIPSMQHHFSLPSTNSYLMEGLNHLPQNGMACFAEHQSAGRGRRGKNWQSSFASGLTFSLAKKLRLGPQDMGGLSLVVALALVEALNSYGLSDLSVKWPNDILARGKKIAGILIELVGESQGPTQVVIGIGVNGCLREVNSKKIDQPWTDVVTETKQAFRRNDCAALLLESLVQHLHMFEQAGLKHFLNLWHQYDAALEQSVTIQTLAGDVQGIGKGVDEQGCLLLQQAHTVTRHSAGEVSLRNPYVID